MSAWRAEMSQFAFGRLGVKTAHASWLAQLDSGILIGAGGTRALWLARARVDFCRVREQDQAAAGDFGQ